MAADTEVVAVEMVRSSWTKGIAQSCNLLSVMSNRGWKAREGGVKDSQVSGLSKWVESGHIS